MPDFIPVLIAAVLLLTILLMVYGGTFVAPSPEIANSKTLLLGEDITIAHNVGESLLTRFDITVSNGIFSQESKKYSFDVVNSKDASEGILRFDVLDTNIYGNLLFYVNDKLVYNKPNDLGYNIYTFKSDFSDSNNRLEIAAESSGWKMWAPTIYKIKGNLSVNYLGEKFSTLKFNISNLELLNLKRATLRIFGLKFGNGHLTAKVNGVEVFDGFTNVDSLVQMDVLKEGENTLELSCDVNTRYDLSSIQIILFFE